LAFIIQPLTYVDKGIIYAQNMHSKVNKRLKGQRRLNIQLFFKFNKSDQPFLESHLRCRSAQARRPVFPQTMTI